MSPAKRVAIVVLACALLASCGAGKDPQAAETLAEPQALAPPTGAGHEASGYAAAQARAKARDAALANFYGGGEPAADENPDDTDNTANGEDGGLDGGNADGNAAGNAGGGPESDLPPPPLGTKQLQASR